MNKRIFLFLIAGLSGMALTLLMAHGSLAQFEIDNPISADELTVIVDNLVDFIFKIAIVVAPLMIVIGALLFTTAGANAEQINRGKKVILWTIIGFIVVLLAQGIVQIAEDLFGVTSAPPAAPGPAPAPPPAPPAPDPCIADPSCQCLVGFAGISSCEAAYGVTYFHDPTKTTCNNHHPGAPEPDRCCCQ